MIERPQWYAIKLPGAGLLGVEIQLDTDAPFRMTGVALYVINGSGTALGAAGNLFTTIRFTRPDGTWTQRHLISGQQLNPFDQNAQNGAGGETAPYYSYFSPLSVNTMYPSGSSIQIDYTPEAGFTTPDNLIVVFVGTKIFDSSRVWSPTYPAQYRARPYFGYDLQINISTLPVLNQPLNIAPDADFVWQCGAQTDQQASALTPVGVTRGIGCIIRDWLQKPYMNTYIPLEMIFGFDNSQTPGMVYPEIYIPKNQALYFDIANL